MQFGELDMAEHACDLNILEGEVRGSGVQSWGGVHMGPKQTNKQANVNHGAVKPTQQKQVLAAKHGRLSLSSEPTQREKEKTDST